MDPRKKGNLHKTRYFTRQFQTNSDNFRGNDGKIILEKKRFLWGKIAKKWHKYAHMWKRN